MDKQEFISRASGYVLLVQNQFPEIAFSPVRYITVSAHMTKTLGCCKKFRKIGFCDLQFSSYLLSCSWEIIKNTILHEICHTAVNSRGHDSTFYKVAELVGKRFGVKIQRYATEAEWKEFSSFLPVHKVICEKCGYTWIIKPYCK
jgi:hypothetical protein